MQDCAAEFDECWSSPCQHGSTCAGGVNNYTCACASLWVGENCAENADVCPSNPCSNDGTCVDHNGMTASADGTEYSCVCQPGWAGNNCDEDVLECASAPCLNGATCIELTDEYQCTCVEGWEGFECDEAVNLCDTQEDDCDPNSNCAHWGPNLHVCTCHPGYENSTHGTQYFEFDSNNTCQNIDECASNPCANDGDCSDQILSYICTCASGFSGSNCAADIDECTSYPCQNGATCVDSSSQPGSVAVDAYYCECNAGFNGTLCDEMLCACSSQPCQNGATCSDSCSALSSVANDWYICSCAPGYTGPDGGWDDDNAQWTTGAPGHCETYLNACDSNPCVSQYSVSECVDTNEGEYMCNCSAGYEGDGNLDYQVRTTSGAFVPCRCAAQLAILTACCCRRTALWM